MPYRRLIAVVAAAGLFATFLGCGTPPATVPEPVVVPPEVTGPPIFEDVTSQAGIDITYHNGEEANHYAIIESLGGGVAVFDFDNDGLPDVFIGGGGEFHGTTVRGRPGKMYRNLGGFKFRDVTAEVGLADPLQYSHGVSAFDYDNDGWLDLLVSGYNRLLLFRNTPGADGKRTFADVTAKAGLGVDHLWSTSTAWGDLNGDGYPEVYVCHYGNWGFDGTGPDGEPYRHPDNCNYDGQTRDVCQPAKFTPLPHALFLNNGDGTFSPISQACVTRTPESGLGPLRADGRGIGVVVADLDNDSRPDVYTANDTDDNFLYLNRGAEYGAGAKVALTEAGLLAGVARDDRGVANGSMGLGVGDYDHSGLASVVVTNYESELPALYRNRTSDPARVRFAYATQSSGLGTINGVFVSWGTGFADFDLNGWDDLYIVNGHAIRHPHKADREMRAMVLLNDSGRLTISTSRGGAFFAEKHNARGSAVGDLDNDGRPDLIVVRHNAPVAVLKNVAPVSGKHWVGISLRGKENRDLVGSRVVVETASGAQTKFVKGGASYGSTDDARLLFGLDADQRILGVTVHWSHGAAEAFSGVSADAYHSLSEGTGTAVKGH